MDAKQRQRRTVFYRGTVQGVGFRYTACRIARGFPVTGYVRNLSNGQVEIRVEATGEDIDRFLSAVEKAMGGCITGSRVETEPATGEYDSFGIGH
jgi:acylphosphatase